jgi:hypothetical protein
MKLTEMSSHSFTVFKGACNYIHSKYGSSTLWKFHGDIILEHIIFSALILNLSDSILAKSLNEAFLLTHISVGSPRVYS